MKNKNMLISIQKNTSSIKAVMIIDKEGKILESIVTNSFASIIDVRELNYIAKLISLRFHIVDFHKILDGLQMTVNIFKDILMLVTSFNDDILVVITTKTIDLPKTIDAILDTKTRFYEKQNSDLA
jgi:hypothetical protein